MKNFLRVTMLAICAIFMVANVSAQVITAERASEIANQFFAKGKQKSAAFRSTNATLTQSIDSRAVTGKSNDAPTFHILTGANGKGFVIVSGEETENPIIGYSFDGTIDTNNLPDGFVDYMTDIDAQVRALREYNAANPQKAAARSAMQKTNYNATSMGNIKVLLETAKWGQHEPFNTQCYTDATGTTYGITGCVPIAFAIVMRYHEWPNEGSGKLCNMYTGNEITDRVYEWDKMPLVYDSNASEEQKNAVAKLVSHLGHAYSVDHKTGNGNEGASTENLYKYFNYNNVSGNKINQDGIDTDINEWIANIKESLDNGCPIPYASDKISGSGDTRHIFVLDGYTDNNYFHINFGWAGSGDGWFLLTAINGSGSDYSWAEGSGHRAFFNLRPNKTPRTVTASVSPAGAGTVTVNGYANSAEVTEGTRATLVATANNGYTFSHWSKGGTEVGTEKTYKALVAAAGNEYVANFLTVGNTTVNVSVSYNSSYGTVTYNSNAVSGTGITPYQNSEVTLVATPLDGYVFNGWTVTKGTNSTNYSGTELTFVATEDMSVEANFSLAVVGYKINNENVTVSGSSTGARNSTWTYKTTIANPAPIQLKSSNGSTEVYGLSNTYPRLYGYVYDATDKGYNSVTYTLSVPEGYLITDYKITYYVPSNYSGQITVSNGATTATPTNTDDQYLLYPGATRSLSGTRSTEFTLTTSQTGQQYIQIVDFSVSVMSEGAEGGESTPTSYTIYATAGAGGSVTINGEAVSQKSVNENSTVTLVATPQTGYNFVNWTSGTSTVVSTDATYSFKATGNTSLVANFEKTGYTVNVTAGTGGSAYIGTKGTTSKTVDYNENVTITAEANDGYKFVEWRAWNSHFSSIAQQDVTVTTDVTYTAVFEAVEQEPAQNITGTIVGVNRIPTEIFDLSQGLKTGYYLLKQVNNHTDAAGGQGVGWIKASSEAAGQPENVGATTEYPSSSRKAVSTSTANPDALCVWYVEVVNAENKEIKISTANKIGSWYLPTGSQRQKGLTSYEKATVLKYHTSQVTMGTQNATPKNGSCFISNSDVSSFIHFSGNELGSWSDANQNSMFMVEFYELSIDDLVQKNIVTFEGATYTKTDGTELTSGWGYQVVTQTTPAVTIKVAENKNNFGYTTGVISGVKTPYLYKNTNFILSISEQYKITGYKITVRGQDNSYSGDFTCSVDGNETSKATLSGTTTQTLSATGLDTNIINISVGGTSGNGIFITALEITYVENEFTPLPFKAEIENWRNDNPNTHLGTITIGGTAVKLTPAHQTASELTMPVVEGTTLAFTRKYRGFEFNGFYIGATSLGTNPTLTAGNVAAINETTPLVAKFTATDDVTLFYDDDEFSYRIPAIAKTGTNRLVAVSDYRHSHDDIGRDNHHTGTNRVDLVMRTSDDNGLTWSEKQTIAEGTSTFGYGDAAIVANGQDILVMAVAGNVFYPNANATNKNKTYRIYSNNNGQSWTKEEVTSNIFGLFDEAYATFFGSGKLAVDPDFNGTGKARVYGAILLKNSARSTNNYVLFSDDWGATWNILGGSKTQIAEADEPKVEILPNGQILLSSRHASGGSRVFNVFTYGNDKAAGEGTWGTAVSGCSNGGSNGTNGEIICLDAKQTNGKPTKILLQSQPQGGSNTWDRKDVTIWYKEIGNETQTPSSIADGWTKGLQVSTVQSAYSAMALQENGEIAFFFEEAPCHNDDNTYGYSMVYVPLTIEEITENNFLNPNADVEYVPVEFNIVLTDAQGNEYRETLDYIPADVAAVESYLTTTYPFITLGTTGVIADNKYTNSVTLPFKVSNAENAYWHNIYWPAKGTSAGEFYPIYLKAETEDATYITKLTEYGKRFGESQYNTYEHADKLGWAVYSVNNTLTFKFKNKLTGKFMAVNGVVSNGDADNVIFTDEAGATVFTLEKYTGANTAWGDYGIKSVYNGTTGYVCNTSADYANATNYTGTGHPGAWVEFGDADYDLLISNLDQGLILFGNGNDKRMLTTEIQAIIDAMGDYDNPLYKTMLLKDLKAHFATLEYAINNWPKISLTIAPVGGGTTKIAGEANVTSKYVPTGQLTVEAVPASGYRFVNWTKGTEEVSTDASYTFKMDAATELTANFEIEESQEGLTTGYYHIVSRVTTSHEYLYNNALRTNNSNKYTLQSDSKIATNNGIWHITVNNTKLGVKNGDGNALVTGAAYCGAATPHNTLNIVKTTIVDGITYYSFTEGINCTNRGQYNFTLEGNNPVKATDNNYVTTWAGHPDDQANQWRLELIDTDGKNIYNVVVECTEQDVYVTYGSGTNEEYAFNGGFFITDATITAQQLKAKKGNDAAQGVTVLVEGNTIRVVDTEYVDITVSASPAEGGTVTINSEATSTKQVVKSSNVTVEATPASGYHFVNWTDAGGNEVSTDASYTFTVSENTSLVANFEADVVYHTITVSTYYNNNGGTVKVGEEDATSVNVAEGKSVRMLATVADGYEFMGWLKDGVIVKNAIDGGLDFEVQGPDYTLYEIKASAEYVAVFSKITETTGLEDGKAYRICGVQGNGRARCIYRDGNTLKWKYDYDNNDVNTIFVAQKNGNAINLISAVGYHGWKASYILGNNEQYNPYAAIKVTYGTRDELRTLYIESGTSSGLFQTNTEGAFSFQNSRGGGLTMIATDEATTDFLFEEVKNYAFQVSAADGSNAKLGTVNLPFATTVPEGVKVYGVDHSEGEQVYMAELELTDNVLPANTPVLIEAAASGKYGFKPAPASANVYETGFAGTLEAEAIPGTTNAYILSYKGVGTHIMLYKLSSTERTINANKAYYIDATGNASALRFVLGGTTDIEDMEGENGEVEAIYDLQGRKLSEITEPGMYIINGKKVWVK